MIVKHVKILYIRNFLYQNGDTINKHIFGVEKHFITFNIVAIIIAFIIKMIFERLEPFSFTELDILNNIVTFLIYSLLLMFFIKPFLLFGYISVAQHQKLNNKKIRKYLGVEDFNLTASSIITIFIVEYLATKIIPSYDNLIFEIGIIVFLILIIFPIVLAINVKLPPR